MKASYEHVFNGNMELNDGWTIVFGGTAGRSPTISHSGKYSWYVDPIQFGGLVSDSWTSKNGTLYELSFWIYRSQGTGNIAVTVRNGDDSGNGLIINITPSLNTWTKYSGSFIESAAGSLANFTLQVTGANNIFYLDNVSVTSQVQATPDPYYKKTLNEKKILITPDGSK